MKGTSRRSGAPASRPGPPASGELRNGLVISHLGQGLAVEAENGQIILCQTRRRLGDVAVGDRVHWKPAEDGSLGRVEEILARQSTLIRPGYAGKVRVVAANVDRVFVVIAPVPEPDWLLVDQYLAVCEFRGIAAEILCNKIDLADFESRRLACLTDYADIGYPVQAVSARSGRGLAELKQTLPGHCSILTGQSGVGKSSLTNALLPDKNLRTSEISARSGLGRHTTTSATLYHLPEGGDLIDTPGVSVFGLAGIRGKDLALGYREFRAHISHCRFNDCRHVSDKDCAVRLAAENGTIAGGRYRRYLKLLEKLAMPDVDWS